MFIDIVLYHKHAGYRLFSRWPLFLGYLVAYLELSGATPTCSVLNYWLVVLSCQLQGQIDWHAFGLETDPSCVEAKLSGLLCVARIVTFLRQHKPWFSSYVEDSGNTTGLGKMVGEARVWWDHVSSAALSSISSGGYAQLTMFSQIVL